MYSDAHLPVSNDCRFGITEELCWKTMVSMNFTSLNWNTFHTFWKKTPRTIMLGPIGNGFY
jgi:hypothetical protein